MSSPASVDLNWEIIAELDAAIEETETRAPSPSTTRHDTPPTSSSQPGPSGRPASGLTTAGKRKRTSVQQLSPRPEPPPKHHQASVPAPISWEDDTFTGRTHLPTRLPSPDQLCWRCGLPGHRRDHCTAQRVLFCSRCGRVGVMSRACLCRPPPTLSSSEIGTRSPPRKTQTRATQYSPPIRPPCVLCGCKRRHP